MSGLPKEWKKRHSINRRRRRGKIHMGAERVEVASRAKRIRVGLHFERGGGTCGCGGKRSRRRLELVLRGL
jgi:hypothetical protein